MEHGGILEKASYVRKYRIQIGIHTQRISHRDGDEPFWISQDGENSHTN